MSLNPYSGGTWFLSSDSDIEEHEIVVLILILVELDFWEYRGNQYPVFKEVLILILVELDFWDKS